MLRFTTFQVTVFGVLFFLLGYGSYRLYEQGATAQKLQQEMITEGFQPLPTPAGGASEGAIQKLAGPELLAVREGMKTNLNTASADELNRLPGIGPSTAQKIIDYRKENGPFQSIEDIVKVPRIGAKLLDKIRDQITVGAPEPAPAASPVAGASEPAAGDGQLEPESPDQAGFDQAGSDQAGSDQSEPEKPKPALTGPVNINTAGADQLELLPRVGPAMAKAIVEYRTQNGPFRSVDDLDKVPRIGRKTVDRLRSLITVGAASEAAAAAPAIPRAAEPQAPSSSSHRGSSKKELAPGETIDINEASEEELARLPGVGPATAQKIVEQRVSNGPFKKIEDIQKVKGIGPAKFAKMKDHLRVQ
jgi:competence protein ComEA